MPKKCRKTPKKCRNWRNFRKIGGIQKKTLGCVCWRVKKSFIFEFIKIIKTLCKNFYKFLFIIYQDFIYLKVINS